jgi:hypothetical protein
MKLTPPQRPGRPRRSRAAAQSAEDERPRNAKHLRFLVRAGVPILASEVQEDGVVLDVPAATQPGEAETVALRGVFSKTFPKDPEGAVDWLTDQVRLGSSRQAAAEVLLPYTVKAPYPQQNLVYAALLELATADDLVDAAFAAHGRNDDPRLLEEAAVVLGQFGHGAWPTLARLARSEKPECRYFLPAIVGLAGVPEGDKAKALADLARHPDVAVRREVLEALESGSLPNAASAWEALARDRDREIAGIATDHLDVLRD